MTSSERDPRTSAAHTTAISGSETARYTNVTVISCYTVRSRSGGMGYRSVKTWRQAGKGRLRPLLNRATFFLKGTRDRFSRQRARTTPRPIRISPRVRLMAASGRTTRRGYGWAHQQLRARFAPQVAAGLVSCARCGSRFSRGSAGTLVIQTSIGRCTRVLSQKVQGLRLIGGRHDTRGSGNARTWSWRPLPRRYAPCVV